jgi:hypothetical protein
VQAVKAANIRTPNCITLMKDRQLAESRYTRMKAKVQTFKDVPLAPLPPPIPAPILAPPAKRRRLNQSRAWTDDDVVVAIRQVELMQGKLAEAEKTQKSILASASGLVRFVCEDLFDTNRCALSQQQMRVPCNLHGHVYEKKYIEKTVESQLRHPETRKFAMESQIYESVYAKRVIEGVSKTFGSIEELLGYMDKAGEAGEWSKNLAEMREELAPPEQEVVIVVDP